MSEDAGNLSAAERVDAAILEYLEAEEAGRPPDQHEFLARYPELAEELVCFFTDRGALQEMQGAMAPQSADAPSAEPTPEPAGAPSASAPAGLQTIQTPPGEERHSTDGAPLELPVEFGRYRVERLLGRGAMGSVHLAEDTVLGRKVALKTPQTGAADSSETEARFLREARLAATLRHRNICQVFDSGEVNGIRFICMAFIDGRPLSQFIDERHLQPPRQVAQLIRKVALALKHAHGRGIVHRDLKPANIMIDGQKEPVIMDFGLARQSTRSDVRVTASGMILGTPAYMSPEHVNGHTDDIGPLSDQFSLGVIFYELLTGQLPFRGNLTAMLGQILNVAPAPPSALREGLDPSLEQICLRMLSKSPVDRYPDSDGLIADLTEYLKSKPGRHATGGPVPVCGTELVPDSKSARRLRGFGRRKLALLGVPLLAACVLLSIWFWPDGRSSESPQHQSPADVHQDTGRPAADPSGEPAATAETVSPASAHVESPPAVAETPPAAPVPRIAEILKDALLVMNFEPATFYNLDGETWVRDVTGRGNDGVCVNATLSSDGKAGGGLRCLGGEVRLPEKLLNRRNEYTVTAWVRTAPAAVLYSEFHPGRQAVYHLSIPAEQRIAISSWNKGNWMGSWGPSTVANQYNFVAATFAAEEDGKGKVRFWVNESTDETDGQREESAINGMALIGAGLRGMIDELAIVPRALSADEIAIVRQHGIDGKPLPANPAVPSERQFVKLRQFTGSSTSIFDVAFTPDGEKLGIASDDFVARLFDVESGALLHAFSNGGGGMRTMAIAPDGRIAVTGSHDKIPHVWDLETGRELPPLEGADCPIYSAAFHPAGSLVALGGQSPEIWFCDVKTKQRTKSLIADHKVTTSLRFTWDGRRLVSAGSDGKCKVWDVQQLTEICRFTHRDSAVVRWVSLSSDGKRAVSCSDAGEVCLWDTTTGDKVREFSGHRGLVPRTWFTPGARHIISGGMDNTVRLWDAETGAELSRITVSNDAVSHIAVSPDGRFLATAGGWVNTDQFRRTEDTTVRIWRMPRVASDSSELAAEPAPALSDRDAATWVLRRGGWVVVRAAGSTTSADAVAALPEGEFTTVEIHLSHDDRMHDADLSRLAALTGLQVLVLNGKCLTDSAFEHLLGCTSLRRLSIAGAPGITGAGLRFLRALRDLEALDLDGSGFADNAVGKLLAFKGLKELGLSGTRVTDAGMRDLGALAALKELRLRGLGLDGSGLVSLKGLPALEKLVLGGNRISDESLALIGGLATLRTLDLYGSPISDQGIGAISGNARLETLIVGGTQVGDKTLQTLASRKNLKELDICESPHTTAAGIAQFQASLPECRISTGSHQLDMSASLIDILMDTSSSCPYRPTTWKFTTESPDAAWATRGFDDTSWSAGPLPYGRLIDPSKASGNPPALSWNSDDIWLRRTFELSPGSLAGMRFAAFHGGSVEIYLNGIPAASHAGPCEKYVLLPLARAARESLRPGSNAVAVHARSSSATRIIDIGLVRVKPSGGL